MKNNLFYLFFVFIIPFVAFAESTAEKEKAIKINNDSYLFPLGDSIYVHVSWYSFQGVNPYPSNELLLIRNGKALLVNTPNTIGQTKELYSYLKDSLKTVITTVIVTHTHQDCLGGLSFFQGPEFLTISSSLTKQMSIEKKLPVCNKVFTDNLTFPFGDEKVSCHYLGGGHTPDNSVVYLTKNKVLYANCLARALDSNHLGSITEANFADWELTLQKMQSMFSDALVVVPTRGEYGDFSLLTHTLTLLKNQTKAKRKK